MKAIFTILTFLSLSASAQASSANLLDIFTNPDQFGIDRTLDSTDKKVFILRGIDPDQAKLEYRDSDCAIRIETDGDNVKIVEHKLDAIAGGDDERYPISLYKSHMNKTYTKLNLKKDLSRVKAEIKDGILTFEQSIYYYGLNGLLRVGGASCVVDLNKAMQPIE